LLTDLHFSGRRLVFFDIAVAASHVQRAATLFDCFFILAKVQVRDAEKPRRDFFPQDGQIRVVAVESI
jgi:hypothetical protein